MNAAKRLIPFLFMVLLFSNCNKDTAAGEWLVPSNEVLDGGPGKDGIPSVDNPQFAPIADIDYMDDDDLVLGFKIGNEVRAYTHKVLDWHEIVNDEVNGFPIAITYCPLTGTGIGWGREVNGGVTEFGVSGLLYNSNLIPYDRNSDSNWSQMTNKCVNGELINTKINTHFLFETTWATWKEMYPNSQVITTNTGVNRNYSSFPYGNYRTSSSINFPISNDDDRLHRKERVLGVLINEQARVYRFDKFTGSEIQMIQDEFQGEKLVIVGNEEKNFIVVFKRVLNGNELTFSVLQNELPAIIEDENGNKYDAFGQVIAGPAIGSTLEIPTTYMGYWFSWGAFYPSVEIFE